MAEKLTFRETVGYLAGGARLRLDSEGYWNLCIDVIQPDYSSIVRLIHEGWVESMPNGGTCKLSDAGLQAYLRSTDELGDGRLELPEPPHA